MANAAERVSVVIPTADLTTAVAFWERRLGVAPTFVDGDRWAQFDTPTGRVSLAGSDGASDRTALSLKLRAGELDEARSAFQSSGYTVGPTEAGPHEQRCIARDDAGAVVLLYESLPATASP
jgi:hypothetical protein